MWCYQTQHGCSNKHYVLSLFIRHERQLLPLCGPGVHPATTQPAGKKAGQITWGSLPDINSSLEQFPALLCHQGGHPVPCFEQNLPLLSFFFARQRGTGPVESTFMTAARASPPLASLGWDAGAGSAEIIQGTLWAKGQFSAEVSDHGYFSLKWPENLSWGDRHTALWDTCLLGRYNCIYLRSCPPGLPAKGREVLLPLSAA